MRRRGVEAAKLRVKILEDYSAGLTYSEIQRKRGASSRTIANLVKGKDLRRFCQMCGETDQEKLEEHHPNKTMQPNETVTLCASCHSKVTRRQQQERYKEQEKKVLIPEVVVETNPPPQQRIPALSEVSYNPRPLTLEEQRWLGKGLCYSIGGIALGEGAFHNGLPGWIRGLLAIGGALFLYGGSRIGRDTEHTDQ